MASTFFGNVGLTEVNLAVSNRSVCGVCTQAIEKKTARFAYHWNRSRPSKWMHSSCLADWLNLNPDMKQQSMEFLTHSLHSATEDLRPCILEALQLLEYMADWNMNQVSWIMWHHVTYTDTHDLWTCEMLEESRQARCTWCNISSDVWTNKPHVSQFEYIMV